MLITSALRRRSTVAIGALTALAGATATAPAAAAEPAPLRATMGLLGADLAAQTAIFETAEPLGDVTGDGRADLSLLSFGDGAFGSFTPTTSAVLGQTAHANVDLGGASSRLLRLPGYAVHAAGDVNGDGIRDVLVFGPAPGFPDGVATAVVFGGPGLAQVDLGRLGSRGFYVANGPVHAAGDLNGDGKDELVGAAVTDAGEMTKLVLISGRRTGGIVVNLRSIGTRGIDLPDSQMPAPARFAHGDVNGDGIDDLAIDQPGTSPKLTVLFGARDFTAISPNTPGSRGLTFTRFARLGGIPGDVTGDGRDDLLVEDASFNRRIVPGPPSAGAVDAGAGGIELEAVADAGSGQMPVAGVGDLTGDGRDDLVVRPQTGSGASFVAGRPAPATVTEDDLVPVPGSFGSGVVAAVGDVDGDGRGDAVQLAGGPSGAFRGATLLTAGLDVLPPLWHERGPFAGPQIEPSAFRPGPGATTLRALLSEPAAYEVVLRTAGGALLGKIDLPLGTPAQIDWDGRVDGRALPPGDYRSAVTPIDEAGNRGETRTVAFTVLP